MSANPQLPEAQTAELRQALVVELARVGREKRQTVWVFIGLALFMVTYLTWLYSSLTVLVNESTLAGIVQVKVRKALPEFKGRLGAYLINDVPRLAERGFDLAQANLPEWRGRCEDRAMQITDRAVDRLDQQLNQLLNEDRLALRRARIQATIDQLKPGGGDAELEAELEQELAKVYTRTCDDAVGTFQEKLQGFAVELQQLCAVPPERLSPADREKLELVLSATAYLESLFAEEGERLTWDLYRFMKHQVPAMIQTSVIKKP